MKQTRKQTISNDEHRRFEKLTDALLAVPHAEIQKRLEQHRKDAAKNPHKRGPKRKAKS
jgi:hypothetical protein